MVAREYLRDGVLPTPGTICNDVTEAVFSNGSNSDKTAATTTTTTTRKRALGRCDLGDLEEQMLEAGRVLSSQSQARFTRLF
jgi:hypothetical protein